MDGSLAGHNRMRVLILGASLSTGNLGVSALAAGTVKCVLSEFPEAEVSFLDYGKSPDSQSVTIQGRSVPISLINIRFSKRFLQSNNVALLMLLALCWRLLPNRASKKWLIAKNNSLQSIHDADLCLSLAGGDSFSDIYGLARLLYVALPQMLVLVLRKRLVLMPQTIGPFRSKLSSTLAGYIVRRAERVYVREQRGLVDIQTLAASVPVRNAFSYDVGFLLEASRPSNPILTGMDLESESARAMPTVGINVSGLLFVGGYNHRNMFNLKVNYRELMYKLIQWLVEEEKARVLLVPHVFGMNVESDLAACQTIFKETHGRYADHLGLLPEPRKAEEVKYIVGQCEFFIGSRMHACIAAVSQQVPATAIAYSDKFIGVMETVGAGAVVADARALTEEQILSVVKSAFHRRATMANALAQSMPQLKQSALTILRGIESLPAAPIATRPLQREAELGSQPRTSFRSVQ